MRRVSSVVAAAVAVAAVWAWQAASSQHGSAAAVSNAAAYTSEGGLQFPSGADRWIAVGSSIGGEYSDAPFDPANPGVIGVVQMEPAAYDYFLENGEYADGTMFLLSFYRPQQKPDPELPGFVQGELAQREIHVIDRRRYPEEGRAFFMFPPEVSVAPAPMPLGSECVVCHALHGAFDGTFTQFYPQLRGHLAGAAD